MTSTASHGPLCKGGPDVEQPWLRWPFWRKHHHQPPTCGPQESPGGRAFQLCSTLSFHSFWAWWVNRKSIAGSKERGQGLGRGNLVGREDRGGEEGIGMWKWTRVWEITHFNGKATWLWGGWSSNFNHKCMCGVLWMSFMLCIWWKW